MEEKKDKTKGKKIFGSILLVLFYVSFVPYLLLIKDALLGADVGFFYSNYVYGFEAVSTTFVLLCIVPFYPVCIIYQALYFIIAFRGLSKLKKKIIIILSVSIIALILFPTLFWELKIASDNKAYYKANSDEINNYLKKNYSEEILDGSKLILKNKNNHEFELALKRPPVSDITTISIWLNDDGSIIDDYVTSINRMVDSEFLNQFSEYVNKFYGMDSDIEIQALIQDIDMSGFSYQDSIEDMFPRCDYKISSVYFVEDSYDKEVIIEKIKSFYNDKYKNMPIQNEYGINFYVKVDNKFYASVQMIDIDPKDEMVSLIFRGYSSNDVTTIPSENIELNVVEE